MSTGTPRSPRLPSLSPHTDQGRRPPPRCRRCPPRNRCPPPPPRPRRPPRSPTQPRRRRPRPRYYHRRSRQLHRRGAEGKQWRPGFGSNQLAKSRYCLHEIAREYERDSSAVNLLSGRHDDAELAGATSGQQLAETAHSDGYEMLTGSVSPRDLPARRLGRHFVQMKLVSVAVQLAALVIP